MKTTVSCIYLQQHNDQGQKESVGVPIRTPSGELMTNRVIQIFSSYPEERIEYPLSLVLEIYTELYDAVITGEMIILAAESKEVVDDFILAAYGNYKSPQEPILSTMRNMLYSANAEIMDMYPGENGAGLHRKAMRQLARLGVGRLVEQMLRARKRICRFNRRHEADFEDLMDMPDELGVQELQRRIDHRKVNWPSQDVLWRQ